VFTVPLSRTRESERIRYTERDYILLSRASYRQARREGAKGYDMLSKVTDYWAEQRNTYFSIHHHPARHHDVLLSITSSCWALRRSARHYALWIKTRIFQHIIILLGTTTYCLASRRPAEHYDVLLASHSSCSALCSALTPRRNLPIRRVTFSFWIWFSSRSEKFLEFRSGPKSWAENSLGQNSCNSYEKYTWNTRML
jgi:hypothetical protein